MTNPFEMPAQSAPAAANPFGQSAAAAPANPFGQSVAAQPVANPFGQSAAPAPAAVAPAPQVVPAPAYAPSAALPVLDPNALGATTAPAATGGKGAALPCMFGRLVLIFPHSLAIVPRKEQHITAEQRAAGNVTQQQLTATVVVLDSGPGTPPGAGTIEWGGQPWAMPPSRHTESDPLPYIRKNMWINQTKLISQLTAKLPAPGQTFGGMECGRVAKRGQAQNDPWYLESATPAEIAICQQYLKLVGEGRYPHPLAGE